MIKTSPCNYGLAMSVRLKTCSFLAVSAILFASSARADNADIDKLLDTPIAELTEMEVTSVSKRSEKASEAAAAIYVITNEDIRRSGMNSLPEVLRLAPGIQVSRINSGWWAITSRGNASGFGNKLLVLIDGRSIYNPLFSGVLWEEQSTPLEDIERIEVIRGPGSTLYGANAVNGVINVITKSAKDTQGALVRAGGGSYENFNGLARVGSKVGDNAYFRAFLDNTRQGQSHLYSSEDNYDDYSITRGGFKYNAENAAGNRTYSVQSDVYNGDRNLPFTRVPAVNVAGFTNRTDTHDLYGGNIVGKYGIKLDSGSDIDLQVYYDFTGRSADIYGHKIHTLDFDGQQTIDLSQNHQFIWGLGYRFVYGDWDQSDIANYTSNDIVTNKLFSAFAQDKIQILPDELFITIGSKIEHNDYTGIEIQPNARVTWLPTADQTVWGSVAKAVRTPSPADTDLRQVAQGTPGGLVVGYGSHAFESEEVIAYELGYRNQPLKNVSIDVAAFYNDYDKLRSFEPVTPGVGEVARLRIDNKLSGMSRGIEIASTWQVTPKWNLTGSYSYLDMDLKRDNDSRDVLGLGEDGRSPTNIFNIRSHYAFSEELEFDTALYFVDDINGGRSDPHKIDQYYRFDARIGYKPWENIELSLLGQNLLDGNHPEFGSANYSQPAEIPRAVYGKVTVRF